MPFSVVLPWTPCLFKGCVCRNHEQKCWRVAVIYSSLYLLLLGSPLPQWGFCLQSHLGWPPISREKSFSIELSPLYLTVNRYELNLYPFSAIYRSTLHHTVYVFSVEPQTPYTRAKARLHNLRQRNHWNDSNPWQALQDLLFCKQVYTVSLGMTPKNPAGVPADTQQLHGT